MENDILNKALWSEFVRRINKIYNYLLPKMSVHFIHDGQSFGTEGVSLFALTKQQQQESQMDIKGRALMARVHSKHRHNLHKNRVFHLKPVVRTHSDHQLV